MTNHYEVNIAKETGGVDYWGNKQYKHWAKVILDEDFESVAKAKYDEICRVFPAPEFKNSLTYVDVIYKNIEYMNIKED